MIQVEIRVCFIEHSSVLTLSVLQCCKNASGHFHFVVKIRRFE